MAKSDKAKAKKPVKTRVVATEDDSASKSTAKNKSTKKATKTVATKTDASKKSKTKAASAIKTPKKRSKYNIFAAFLGYLKGSWYELTQVRWPNRKETWGMTVGVLLFSAFFVVLILGLDAIYKYLFDFILEG